MNLYVSLVVEGTAFLSARWRTVPSERECQICCFYPPSPVTGLVLELKDLRLADLGASGIPLNHIKPHGALFAMVARSDEPMSELYVDLNYRADRTVIVNRNGHVLDLERAARRTRHVMEPGILTAVTGEQVPVRPDIVCIHSNLPNAVELATTVRQALREQQR